MSMTDYDGLANCTCAFFERFVVNVCHTQTGESKWPQVAQGY